MERYSHKRCHHAHTCLRRLSPSCSAAAGRGRRLGGEFGGLGRELVRKQIQTSYALVCAPPPQSRFVSRFVPNHVCITGLSRYLSLSLSLSLSRARALSLSRSLSLCDDPGESRGPTYELQLKFNSNFLVQSKVKLALVLEHSVHVLASKHLDVLHAGHSCITCREHEREEQTASRSKEVYQQVAFKA